jgi:hypothetical protein
MHRISRTRPKLPTHTTCKGMRDRTSLSAVDTRCMRQQAVVVYALYCPSRDTEQFSVRHHTAHRIAHPLWFDQASESDVQDDSSTRCASPCLREVRAAADLRESSTR